MTETTKAVFVISVAAELAGMHPQTLRIYERRGLVNPARTQGGNRRYSDADIERLQRIADLAHRAQNKKLDLSELEGGTFTISNLELTAQTQDSRDRRRMIPVASLVPENPDLGSVNIGALGDPSRGHLRKHGLVADQDACRPDARRQGAVLLSGPEGPHPVEAAADQVELAGRRGRDHGRSPAGRGPSTTARSRRCGSAPPAAAR